MRFLVLLAVVLSSQVFASPWNCSDVPNAKDGFYDDYERMEAKLPEENHICLQTKNWTALYFEAIRTLQNSCAPGYAFTSKHWWRRNDPVVAMELTVESPAIRAAGFRHCIGKVFTSDWKVSLSCTEISCR